MDVGPSPLLFLSRQGYNIVMAENNQIGSDNERGRLREIPSVDRVLQHAALTEVRQLLPHSVIVAAVRDELHAARAVAAGDTEQSLSVEEIAMRALARAGNLSEPTLRRVINATGVVIHTNLGRAPLSDAAKQAMLNVAAYSNLEYDLEQGARSSRYRHATATLKSVTGCEDALVVNNAAAALVLVLVAFAAGKEVILSRGQSVEIGGGFRIPDVMRQSGANLVEVGTTNRTYIHDYAEAIGETSAILMRVHASNFRIVGFTTTPSVNELAELAHGRGLLMVDDIGSGALLDTSKYGLAPEPMVQASLKAGADIVIFSGDKLLGGPQCGIIAGRGEYIGKLKKHPLARALRVDKLTLAALEATLLHYLKGEAEQEVPVWRMISAQPSELQKRAEGWAGSLRARDVACAVEEGLSAVGGGSLPGETLPTWLVTIKLSKAGDKSAEEAAGDMARALRLVPISVVGRVERGVLLLDPRTVPLEAEEDLLETVANVYRFNERGVGTL